MMRDAVKLRRQISACSEPKVSKAAAEHSWLGLAVQLRTHRGPAAVRTVTGALEVAVAMAMVARAPAGQLVMQPETKEGQMVAKASQQAR